MFSEMIVALVDLIAAVCVGSLKGLSSVIKEFSTCGRNGVDKGLGDFHHDPFLLHEF